MIVIVQQTLGIADKAVFLEGLIHFLLENEFILIRIKDLLFSVTSGDNMIDGIFKIDSQWSGHEIILGYYSVNVKCEDLTP